MTNILDVRAGGDNIDLGGKFSLEGGNSTTTPLKAPT